MKPSLLIAEDDFENQKLLTVFLTKYFNVDLCDSTDSFYALLNKERYDLIVMDISIRGNKNGLDLTRELRSNPKYSDIPIVCYTAHAFNRDRINALDAGCDVYISKPTNIYVLLDALMDLLKSKGKLLLDGSFSGSYATT